MDIHRTGEVVGRGLIGPSNERFVVAALGSNAPVVQRPIGLPLGFLLRKNRPNRAAMSATRRLGSVPSRIGCTGSRQAEASAPFEICRVPTKTSVVRGRLDMRG